MHALYSSSCAHCCNGKYSCKFLRRCVHNNVSFYKIWLKISVGNEPLSKKLLRSLSLLSSMLTVNNYCK